MRTMVCRGSVTVGVLKSDIYYGRIITASFKVYYESFHTPIPCILYFTQRGSLAESHPIMAQTFFSLDSQSSSFAGWKIQIAARTLDNANSDMYVDPSAKTYDSRFFKIGSALIESSACQSSLMYKPTDNGYSSHWTHNDRAISQIVDPSMIDEMDDYERRVGNGLAAIGVVNSFPNCPTLKIAVDHLRFTIKSLADMFREEVEQDWEGMPELKNPTEQGHPFEDDRSWPEAWRQVLVNLIAQRNDPVYKYLLLAAAFLWNHCWGVTLHESFRAAQIDLWFAWQNEFEQMAKFGREKGWFADYFCYLPKRTDREARYDYS